VGCDFTEDDDDKPPFDRPFSSNSPSNSPDCSNVKAGRFFLWVVLSLAWLFLDPSSFSRDESEKVPCLLLLGVVTMVTLRHSLLPSEQASISFDGTIRLLSVFRLFPRDFEI
jgi:hypothetical protein